MASQSKSKPKAKKATKKTAKKKKPVDAIQGEVVNDEKPAQGKKKAAKNRSLMVNEDIREKVRSKRIKRGAPEKYKKEYVDLLIEFFDQPPFHVMKDNKGNPIFNKYGDPVLYPTPLPTLERFASDLGVVKQTLHNWADKYPEFLDAIKRARQTQKAMLTENTLNKLYDARFGTFVALNCTDMGDKEPDETAPAGRTLADVMKKRIEGGDR